LGEAQGRIRLKGLFALGLLVLALGYVVPTVGVASGPVTPPVAATLSARLDAPPPAWKPRALLMREDARVYDGRQVTFAERQRTVQLPVPFGTRQVPDSGLPAGATVVAEPGAFGVLTRVFEDDLVDGDLIATTQLSEQQTAPADRVIRVGTGAPPQAAPVPDLTGAPAAFARAIAGSSTAYCDLGHTATGTLAGPGSIAVDPNVIPLGSHLYVPGYGYGWAVDTGGAIKGTIVDVWMSCPAAIQWGRRQLTIYVLAS
jgi:3D (Asp-Asp-Asp) domain-containing protein